jgi:hypothetical protein
MGTATPKTSPFLYPQPVSRAWVRLARRDLATNTERVLQSDLVSDLIHLEVSSQTTSALVHAISEGTSDDGGSFAVDNLTLTKGGHDG